MRDVENNSSVKVSMPEKPLQVWTIYDLDLDKAKTAIDTRGLIHNQTAFVDDRMHDWDWKDGIFRFYSHSGHKGEKHNLAIVYEK